jgi:DNA-binding SARP family transcriptional activator
VNFLDATFLRLADPAFKTGVFGGVSRQTAGSAEARVAVSAIRQQAEPGGGTSIAALEGQQKPRLTLLGGFGLQIGDETVPLAPSPQRLLALLALREAALSRAYMAGQLWSDSTEAHAHGSLRSALWKLRTALPGIVWARGDNLALCPDVDVDVQRATRLSRALVSGCFDEDPVTALLEPRFTCELLPGWYDEWVLVERERHRQLCLHALESLCEHLTVTRRYGAAVLAGLAAIDREPLRESAYRALITVHLAEGNVGEAVRRYRLYEKIAARDLGVAPSPMMCSLLSGIATA